MTFHLVSAPEYERLLALFKSGRYTYDITDTTFDMAEHNRLLDDTKEEVLQIRQRQKKAQDEMQKHEDDLMAKWMEEKAAGKVPMDKVSSLLEDPEIEKVASPLNANVWKVVIKEGEKVKPGKEVVVLEAMKLEISVRIEEGVSGVVEKVLVRPGDVVGSGDAVILVRKA